MNIIANNVASKLFVAFVAAAMLFTLATPAKAATATELQAQIDALMAQIAALSGSTGGSSSSSCASIPAPLTLGAQGADVTALQNFLMGAGQTIAAGATGYFGAQTQTALAAWQSANGVSPAAGYYGPVTKAAVDAKCAMSDDHGDDDHGDDDSSDDDMSSGDLSGEASFDTDELEEGDDSDVEEGGTGEVAEYTVEFSDGDARITRLDLDFGVTGTEEDAWDTFEAVSLWVDGEEVATKATDDKDAWLDEDAMTLRFAGLDIVAMEDEEVVITISVETQSSVDDLPATWNVDVTSMRYLDADDVSSTETISETAVDFDVEEAGGDDELIVKTSTTDPDATTLELDDDAKSDWETVFAFDLDTDDSVNDIEVTDLKTLLAFTEDGTTATSSALLLSDVRFMLDGDEIGDVTLTHNAPVGTASATVEFDNGELTIDAGDRVTIEVQAKFLALVSTLEGATVQGSITTTGLSAEGADDLASGQKSGSATGEEHTLRTEGAALAANDLSETYKTNAADDTTDDEGVFVIKFDVTAFNADLWVTKTAASSSALSGSAGVNYIIEDSNGNQVGAPGVGTSTASLSSTADTDGSRFKVNEGETETFTLTIEWDPSSDGYFQAQLVSFNFNATSNGAADNWQAALPSEDYQTDQLSIEG